MKPILAPESIDLIALAPVLVLSVFAMGVLVLDLWAGKNKTLVMFVSLVGLLMTAISAFAKNPIPAFAFTDSYIVDHLSLFFTCIFTLSSGMAILLSEDYNEREGIKVGEYYALILLCTVGMIVLASSTDMIMIFLGIEIVSICLYVLAGFKRDDPVSNEAALKYFLLGAFATGFLLYGMTLVYGSTGSTNLFKIASHAYQFKRTNSHFILACKIVIPLMIKTDDMFVIKCNHVATQIISHQSLQRFTTF